MFLSILVAVFLWTGVRAQYGIPEFEDSSFISRRPLSTSATPTTPTASRAVVQRGRTGRTMIRINNGQAMDLMGAESSQDQVEHIIKYPEGPKNQELLAGHSGNLVALDTPGPVFVDWGRFTFPQGPIRLPEVNLNVKDPQVGKMHFRFDPTEVQGGGSGSASIESHQGDTTANAQSESPLNWWIHRFVVPSARHTPRGETTSANN